MSDAADGGFGEKLKSMAEFFGPWSPSPSLKAIAEQTGETDRAKIWPYIPSVVPANIDFGHFGIRPLFLGIFFGAFHIDTPQKVTTLAGTYDLAHQYLAPFMVKNAIDMLPDLVDATTRNPNTRIIFLGRDAFSLGFITYILHPQFHEKFCRDLYLSRSIVDAALRELEQDGRSFAAVQAFRKSPRPDSCAGPAWQALTRYFEEKDVYPDRDDAEIILIDTGYKGSIQEMLAAAYPATRFRGHYIFYAAAPQDPHLGSKKGHVLHLDFPNGFRGLALRGPLPDDHELTFAHHEAIVALEELLQGSHLSPTKLSPGGKPLTLRQRHDPRPLEGLNPILIAPEYTDPYVREAILSMNVLAISNYAADLAKQLPDPDTAWYRDPERTDWYAELADHVTELRNQIRMWVIGANADPAFGKLLSSFVHRVDKQLVTRLMTTMNDVTLPDDEQYRIWTELNQEKDLDAKRVFTERILERLQA